MLPAILYNNMEGTSNQSNFGVGYDDTVILNSVRNRKKVTELANCPVCSCTIRPGELEAHLTLEVERLQKLSSGCNKRKLSSSNSNLTMPGSSSTADNVEEVDVDVTGCLGSDVYQRVHNNRLRRLRSRSRRASSPPQTGECPVCNTVLPVSRLQRHALRCLKRTGADVDEDIPDTSSEEGSIDVENDEEEPPAGGSFGAEYEWCGSWRLRATALVQGGALASNVRRGSSDGPLVVDGDEDTELYGPPQYSPSRIAPNSGQQENGSSQTQAEDVVMASQQQSETEDGAREKEDCVRKYNGLVEASAETRIQALKARIRDLEAQHNTGNETKCLICLSPHTSPTVSIQCWHVYCEVCWLDSLRAKKICPQCNAITNVQHLRRIYM